jgi:sugar lactone lactonase YvrE
MKQFMEKSALLADTGDLCGECPVWDPRAQRLYWTDCVGLKFHCYDWRSRAYRLVKAGVEIYGFRPNRRGGFVVTNTSGVWLWGGDGDLALVAAEAEGTRLQLNDCCADSAGRLITGSFFYTPAGEYELGKLIRIDTDGSARVLDDGYHLANGIGFSPDERTLYAADTVARRIYRYDYDPATGSAARRRVFVTAPGDEGLPDGLAVDAEGFVWSAQWYGSGVVRYDPDGVVERRLAVPAKQTSSVAFGGPQLTDLFITSAAQSERMPVMPPGYDPDTGPFGGPIYHVPLGIAGQVQHPADLGIPR